MTPAERNRLYKARHPDRVAAARKAYKAEHAEELRAKSRERERQRRETAKADVFTALGNCCARCGFADIRALQIDHVNDDGYKFKIERLDWVKYTRHVMASLDSGRFQLLCANCNWIKKAEREAIIRAENDARRPTPRRPRRPFGDEHFSLRYPDKVSRGEARYNAKLDEQKVREIRASSDSALSLARRFGVNAALIYRVRQHLIWKHVA